MIAIIWVVILVAVAIWQLSLAPGQIQLQGKPFEHEVVPRPETAKPSRQEEPTPEYKTTLADLTSKDSEELESTAGTRYFAVNDLMNAVVLSEILAPPRAKKVRR